MCGIIAGIGTGDLYGALAAMAHRGPDGRDLRSHAGVMLGQRRLAIQDTRPEAGGIYEARTVALAYNGELFNGEHIRGLVDQQCKGGFGWRTSGDTETVAAALAVLHPLEALAEFDGMFALAWADLRWPGVLHLARDRMGEVPLHLHLGRGGPVACSELKALSAMGRRGRTIDVAPGQLWQISREPQSFARTRFAGLPKPRPVPVDPPKALREAVSQAVDRRLVADVPVCALLSGGLDSTVIAYELARRVRDLTAYTAVMDRASPDLKHARAAADHLGIKLVEVTIPPPTPADLAATVKQIELPFKAQAEIGWACLHLAKAIAADGHKVTYSGEGSDELWASYGFAYHGVRQRGWTTYRQQLIADQARKNFPRVNKAFMAGSVEARLPFLDPGVVRLALGLPQHVVRRGSRPKAVLEDAYADVLPPAVLRRTKLAFQDGLGMKSAAADAVADPGRFYRAEFARAYG